MNTTINFWSEEESKFSGPRKNSPFLTEAKAAKNFTKQLKNKLSVNSEKIVRERSEKDKSELVERNGKRGELKDEHYDGTTFVIPEVTLGTHGTMEDAYKSAYQELAKKSDKMETTAINYINKIKSESVDYRESIEKKNVQDVLKIQEESMKIIEDEFPLQQYNSRESSNMCKMIKQFTPPKYFKQKIKSAAALLIFLNENVVDYWSEINATNFDQKIHVIKKIFDGDDSIQAENFKEKTKIFFTLDGVVKGLNDGSLSESDLFLNLVQYLYHCSPLAVTDKRKSGQSWLVFFKKLFTLKQYCNRTLTDGKICSDIVNEMTRDSSLMNTTKEVELKFNRKFQVKQMLGNNIGKSELINFAMELDAFYSDQPTSDDSNKYSFKALEVTSEDKLNKLLEQLAGLKMNDGKSENGNNNFNNNSNDRITGANGNSNFNNNNNGQYNNLNCFNCGGTDHKRLQCMKPQSRCNTCSQFGHIDTFCEAVQRIKNINSNRSNGYGFHSNRNNNQFNNNYGTNNSYRRDQSQWRNNNSPQHNSSQNGGQRRPWNNNKKFASMYFNTHTVLCGFNDKGDLREYLNVTLENGIGVKALVDTGATRNGIGARLLSEYGVTDQIDKSKACQAQMADGKLVATMGDINLTCNVEGRDELINFAVCESLKPDIIFGIPFLAKHKVLNDLRDSLQSRIRSKNGE